MKTLEYVRFTGKLQKNGSFKIIVSKDDQRVEGLLAPEDALSIAEGIMRHYRRNKSGEIEFSYEGFGT